MKRRSGSALVIVVGGLTFLLLMVALVVDVGVWYTRRAQVQMNADIAVLSAMGTIDLTKTYAQQRAFVIATAQGILQNNGYDTSQWSITPVPDSPSNPVLVARTTIVTTQSLPTFFLKVVSAVTPKMTVQSVAEGIRVKATLPPCGFIAKKDINYGGAGGGVIDSYNSNFGGYQATNLLGGKYYDLANAVGCANGSIDYNGNIAQYGSLYSHGTVTLTGGAALIDGDVEAAQQVLVGQSTVIGTIRSYANVPNFVLPPITYSVNPATTNNNNTITIQDGSSFTPFAGTNLSANGGKTVHIPAGGTYYFTSLTMSGGASVVIDGNPATAGKTKIYMAGDFKNTGGISFNLALTAAGTGLGGVTAKDLTIYGLPGCNEIEIGGNTKIVADIYAPNSKVWLHGNQHLYGRIRANDIEIDGVACFTFDEGLGFGNVDTDSYTIRVHLVD